MARCMDIQGTVLLHYHTLMNNYYDNCKRKHLWLISTVKATTSLNAAKAVNTLMGFSSGDQRALLEVLQDYFTAPDGPAGDDWDDDDNTDDDTGASELLEVTLHSSSICKHYFND